MSFDDSYQRASVKWFRKEKWGPRREDLRDEKNQHTNIHVDICIMNLLCLRECAGGNDQSKVFPYNLEQI